MEGRIIIPRMNGSREEITVGPNVERIMGAVGTLVSSKASRNSVTRALWSPNNSVSFFLCHTVVTYLTISGSLTEKDEIFECW